MNMALLRAFWRRLMRENIIYHSATLTFFSMIAFIPVLKLVYWVANEISSQQIAAQVENYLVQHWIPNQPELWPHVQQAISQASHVPVVSMLMVLFSVSGLFMHINRVLGSLAPSRVVKHHWIHLIGLLGLILYAVGVSLYAWGYNYLLLLPAKFIPDALMAWLISHTGWWDQLISLAVNAVIMSVLYRYCLASKLLWSRLYMVSLSIMVLIEIARVIMHVILQQLSGIEVLFGTLVAAPWLMWWLFIVWTIAILGAIVVVELESSDEPSQVN